ncbi:hypothetical protein Tco_0543502 [Tanacetum coccineum]
MTDMSTKWKTWKHEIKKSSYDSSLTVDEIVALQTDDRVDLDPKERWCSAITWGMYCLTRTYKDGRIVNAKAAKVVEAIKTMGESSTAQETRTDGSPYWIDDDLAKIKGPERGGNVRCVGKFPAAKKRRVQDPQVPVLKATKG